MIDLMPSRNSSRYPMPTMPPLVSTSSTRMLRASPKAWPLSQGVCGHGTLSMVVRMALMVMSVMDATPLATLCGLVVAACKLHSRACQAP